ncbi:hypothetical protein AYO47_06240 [Planctomyces sp. SCGC AG-212-M04]|nr:hypothetical protein AYO47_06240 [Planctomyces sp. SCGC AG-212-M04]
MDAKPEAAEVKPDAPESPPPESILVIDVGGSKIKLLVSGQTEPRKMVSGTLACNCSHWAAVSSLLLSGGCMRRRLQ